MFGKGSYSIKVLHVIRSIDPSTGGPAFAVMHMAEPLADEGVFVDIATTHSPREASDKYVSIAPDDESRIRCFSFPRLRDDRWSFSLKLWKWLKVNISGYDLIHITGVFTFPVMISAYQAKKSGVPYIIRPAGTLDSYPLAQKAWRKKIFYRLILKDLLDNAFAIHVTSISERNQLRLLGVGGKCVVIPLAAQIPDLKRIHTDDNRIRLIFLSRIHPKKGLPVLLEALAILDKRDVDYSLVIAGAASASYLNELVLTIEKLGIRDLVSFSGFVEGEEKERLLRNSDIFVLPSYQENFGIAVVEAMAMGVPVVVTDQVAVSAEISESGAGKVVPIDQPELLAEAIQQFEKANIRNIVGEKAASLVNSKFSSDALRHGLYSLYSDAINN